MAEEPGVRGVELPLRAERDRTVSVPDILPDILADLPVLCSALTSVRNDVGLRGAVDPELVREVELSSCSAVYERRVSMDAGRGRDDLFGLRDPPSDARSLECLATLKGSRPSAETVGFRLAHA